MPLKWTVLPSTSDSQCLFYVQIIFFFITALGVGLLYSLDDIHVSKMPEYAIQLLIKSVSENVIWQFLAVQLLLFFILCSLLIHGFKQQYLRMSLEWILDKPLALGLGPHPHLSSACFPSLALSLSPSLSNRHTHIQGHQKHYRHSANLIKRDFVMRISPTASWPEWQQCGWMEKQEEDRRTMGSSSEQWIGLRVCVSFCVSVLKPVHVYIQHMC